MIDVRRSQNGGQGTDAPYLFFAAFALGTRPLRATQSVSIRVKEPKIPKPGQGYPRLPKPGQGPPPGGGGGAEGRVPNIAYVSPSQAKSAYVR